jgi:hypothetical protein
MELIMNTSNPEITDLAITDMEGSDLDTTDIEELLRAAGIEFTVVQRCPHPQCVVCADSRLSVAA